MKAAAGSCCRRRVGDERRMFHSILQKALCVIIQERLRGEGRCERRRQHLSSPSLLAGGR